MGRLSWAVWGAMGAAGAWIFRQAGAGNFVYRDAAHFYYPLFQLVQAEWQAGRVPLWNPYENSGMPLLGLPTASVLYPGQLVFALPWSFDTGYKVYILMHVVLAALNAYVLGRRWGVSVLGAGLGAMSYALAGNVMFHYCNVVFLCGAAWFPLALWAGDSMLVRRSWPAAAGLGGVLALMVLSGDPQMAYWAGLWMAVGAWLRHRAEKQTREETSHLPAKWKLLLAAACWSLCFSAMQVWPSWELTSESDRSFKEVPGSLYDLPSYAMREAPHAPRPNTGEMPNWYDGLVGHPLPGSHQASVYSFSVAPWRWVEFVWPNFGGKQFPVNRRWLEIIPAEGSLWTPSMYMGLIPFLLGLAQFQLRSSDVRRRWMSSLVLVGLLGAMGSFGLVWIVREALVLLTHAPHDRSWKVGDEVGGLYWMMCMVLPKFADFRYPAKLLTPAALGISMLAAGGFDRWMAGELPQLTRWGKRVAWASLALAVVAAASWPAREWLFSRTKPDSFFGPLDLNGVYLDFFLTCGHTTLLCLLLLWISKRPWSTSGKGVTIVCLTALDLAVAQGWMAPTAPAEYWNYTPITWKIIEEAEKQRKAAGEVEQPFRVLRLTAPGWNSPNFAGQPSPLMQADGMEWDQGTLFPKYNLMPRAELVHAMGTLELVDYMQYWSPSHRPHPKRRNATQIVQPRRSADAWGAKYFILPINSNDTSARSTVGLTRQWLEPLWSPERPQGAPLGDALPPALLTPIPSLEPPADCQVLYNPHYLPRAWIVHNVQIVPPFDRYDVPKIRSLLQAIIYPYHQWFDVRQTALLEVEDKALLEMAPQGRVSFLPGKNEKCKVVLAEPQRVELQVELDSPGVVVLADTYYPGWQLDVAPLSSPEELQPAAILRTNRMMRGAWLMPGRWRLVYQYRPASFVWGLSLSSVSIFLCGVWLVWTRIKQRFKAKETLPSEKIITPKLFKRKNP